MQQNKVLNCAKQYGLVGLCQAFYVKTYPHTRPPSPTTNTYEPRKSWIFGFRIYRHMGYHAEMLFLSTADHHLPFFTMTWIGTWQHHLLSSHCHKELRKHWEQPVHPTPNQTLIAESSQGISLQATTPIS